MAPIPNMPLPVPMSNTLSPSVIYDFNAPRQSCVVSCEPVPNAVPGSISISLRLPSRSSGLSSAGTSSQLGLMRKSSILIGLKNFFQLSRQSVSLVSPSSMRPSPISMYLRMSSSSALTVDRSLSISTSVHILSSMEYERSSVLLLSVSCPF